MINPLWRPVCAFANELGLEGGKGRSAYYVPGPQFADDSAPVRKIGSDHTKGHTTPAEHSDSAPVDSKGKLPEEVKEYLDDIGSRASKKQMNLFLLSACRWRNMKLQEMADVLDRDPKYILRKYIQPLMVEEKLEYTITDMPNHPKQAYTIAEKGEAYLLKLKQ